MKILTKILPLIVFIICYFVAVQLIQNKYVILILPILSAIFVWASVVWAKNSIRFALVAVLALTLVIPLVGLYVIGSAVYESWQETIKRLFEAITEHGLFYGLEFILPFVTAVVSAYLVKRYNNAAQCDAAKLRAWP